MTHHLLIERMKEAMPQIKQKSFEINVILFTLRYYCAQKEETSLFRCHTAEKLLSVYEIPANFSSYNFDNKENSFKMSGNKTYKYTQAERIHNSKQSGLHDQVTKYKEMMQFMRNSISMKMCVEQEVGKQLQIERKKMKGELANSERMLKLSLDKLRRRESTVMAVRPPKSMKKDGRTRKKSRKAKEAEKARNIRSFGVQTRLNRKSKSTQKNDDLMNKLRKKVTKKDLIIKELKHELKVVKNRKSNNGVSTENNSLKTALQKKEDDLKESRKKLSKLNEVVESLREDKNRMDRMLEVQQNLETDLRTELAHLKECNRSFKKEVLNSRSDIADMKIELKRKLMYKNLEKVDSGCQTIGPTIYSLIKEKDMLVKELKSERAIVKELEVMNQEANNQLNRCRNEVLMLKNKVKDLEDSVSEQEENLEYNPKSIQELIDSNRSLLKRLGSQTKPTSQVKKGDVKYTFGMAAAELKKMDAQREHYNYRKECSMYGGDCIRDCSFEIKKAIKNGNFSHSSSFIDDVYVYFRERSKYQNG